MFVEYDASFATGSRIGEVWKLQGKRVDVPQLIRSNAIVTDIAMVCGVPRGVIFPANSMTQVRGTANSRAFLDHLPASLPVDFR